MSANAQSFDAKLAKVVSRIREIILVDLDAQPVTDEQITCDLTLMLAKWAIRHDIENIPEDGLNDTHTSNLCLGCGVDMGECNPRQYCRKTYCPNIT
jgi:hypothetical protein